jgi:hypothetical protein
MSSRRYATSASKLFDVKRKGYCGERMGDPTVRLPRHPDRNSLPRWD